MLDRVIEQTNEYIEKMPKQLRKQYGQFFTSKETAVYMAKMFDVPEKEDIYILDPGAGTGILTCALIEELERQGTTAALHLTCYENDEQVLELLRQNLELIQNEASKLVEVKLYEENYIVSQEKIFLYQGPGRLEHTSKSFESTCFLQEFWYKFIYLLAGTKYLTKNQFFRKQ